MQLTYDVVDDPGQQQCLLMLVGAFLLLSVIIQGVLCISNLPLLRVMNSCLCCFVVDVLLFPDRINNRSHVQLYKDRMSYSS